MKTLPYISIIIPVYNSKAIIGDCIQSLLDQDYPKDKLEIIVVDNNSTDGTAETIKQYPVQYLLEDKIQSSYAARNKGAQNAKGEALLFFDADQIVEKDFLKKFARAWDDTQYSAFGAQYIPIGDQKTLAGKYWHTQETTQFTNPADGKSFAKLGGGNTLIRKEVFHKLGGYDSNLVSWGDYDFSYRLRQAGYKVKYMDDAVIGHKERNTIQSLLRREYRIGFGRSSFDRKHKETKESIALIFIQALGRTLLGILALLWGLMKPLQNENRKNHLGLIILDVAMRWAYFQGRVHFILKLNKIPAKW